MSVNLYDSPAQARFINTYVPIKFDGLYKIADDARKNLEATESSLDEIDSYKNLNSVSNPDKQRYGEIINEYENKINSIISSPQDILDPGNQAIIKSLSRKMKSNEELFNIRSNADRLNKHYASEDPRWEGVEKMEATTWDTRTMGTFNLSNTPYTGFDELYSPYTDKLEKTFDKNMSKGTPWDYYTITGDRIAGAIESGTPEVYNNPIAKKHWMRAKLNGSANNYIVSDKDGNINESESYAKFLKERGYAAHADKAVVTREANQVEAERIRFNRQWALSRTPKEEKDGVNSPVNEMINYQANRVQNQKDDLYDKKIRQFVTKNPNGTYTIRGEFAKTGIDKSKAAGYLVLADERNNSWDQYQKAKNAYESGGRKESDRKVLESAEKSFDNINSRYDSMKNWLFTQIELGAQEVASGNSKSFLGITGKDIAEAHIIDIPGSFSESFSNGVYGTESINLYSSDETSPIKAKRAYGSSSNYDIVEPATMNSDSSNESLRMSKAIMSGKFDANSYYVSGAKTKFVDGGRSKVLGSLYIPLKDVAMELGIDPNNPDAIKKAAKRMNGRIEQKTMSPETKSADGTKSKEAVSSTFVVIPVSRTGWGVDEESRTLLNSKIDLYEVNKNAQVQE